jgi:hypothetical protein
MELVGVGDMHEVVVPCSLKVQAPEPDFESGRDLCSVRITIEMAGGELIFSATPLPGAPTVGAESSPDTN